MFDTLLKNARIHTQDPQHPLATAVGLHQGRVISLDYELSQDLFTQVIDLNGATVVPGFNDTHCHLSHIGEAASELDLRPGQINSMAELLAAVELRSLTTEEGKWVTGSGYDQNYLGAHPTAAELDAVSHGHPVYLIHNSRHMGVANTAAFELAGFPQRLNVPCPAGGAVPVDSDGRALGLLQETARALVMDIIPPKSVTDVADMVALGSEIVLNLGITSIAEPGIGAPDHIGLSRLDMAGFQLAKAQGRLGVRATVMPYLTTLHTIGDESVDGHPLYSLDLGTHSGLGDEFLRIGPTKVLSDGSLIGRSAFMCCDYEADAGNRGLLQFSEGELRERLIGAHLAGWQVAVHAIGDAALDLVMDIFEEAQKILPRVDARHRVEHVSVASDAQISRMATLGLIPVPQGRFVTELGDGVVRAMGSERSKLAYRVKSFIDAGIEIPASTDAPVVDANPILNIAALVTRVTASGADFFPDEAISVEQAVRAYTVGSARAVHEEQFKGTLSHGMLADLVVLSDDIFTVPKQSIQEVTVSATVVGGVLVAGALPLASR